MKKPSFLMVLTAVGHLATTIKYVEYCEEAWMLPSVMYWPTDDTVWLRFVLSFMSTTVNSVNLS